MGDLLRRYTVGKIPKAFKIIPALANWEEVLYLTNPSLEPHAMYRATRLFASNLNARMAQRFYSLVLLPRVRDDIAEHKRLHFALYQALRKATFKRRFTKGSSSRFARRAAACCSGVVLRLGADAREHPHAAQRGGAAETGGAADAGTTSFFLRVLLDKKYALPFPRGGRARRSLSALPARRAVARWCGTSRCCAAQRYKAVIRAEDKVRLRRLVDQQHLMIGPEIKRELSQGGAGARRSRLRRRRRREARSEKTAESARRSSPKPAAENPRDMPEVAMLGDDDY